VTTQTPAPRSKAQEYQRRRRSDALTKFGFALVLLTTILAVIYPVYWMFVGSFAPEGYILANTPLFLPDIFSLDAYRSLFARKPMFLWIWNTLVVTVAATAITLPLALLASYSLNRFRFRGRIPVVFFVLLTQLLPASALIVPLFLIFRTMGLLDSLPGITIAYTSFTLPLAIWVLWGYLQSIPFDFEEAALVDGCSHLGAFFRVTLPLAVPGIAATALFIFLECWNHYLLALVLTSSSSNWVISLGLFSFIGEYVIEVEQMLAASVVTVIPAFVLFATLQRYLRGGLSLGGMKG
jgi:multiple sugar transport system permease protein